MLRSAKRRIVRFLVSVIILLPLLLIFLTIPVFAQGSVPGEPDLIAFDNLAIAGVSVIVLVLGWVEVAKKLGVQGNWALILSLILGTLMAGLWKALQSQLVPAVWVPWIEVGIVGLGGGLAASGLYDLGKRFLPGRSQ